MNVVLIGSGNVAWNLGRLLKQQGHTITQIYSRNATAASELAYELDTESANYLSILKPADIYLVCISDDGLPELAEKLQSQGALLLHTSGMAPLTALKAAGSRHYGVLYPLQSLKYGNRTLPEIPFLVEGDSAATTSRIVHFALTLSANVQAVNTEQRQKMHLAAVLVNNFTNYLYIQAEDWCTKNGLPFKALLPLVRETASRLTEGAADWQTGPAVRNDQHTLDMHRQLLAGEPELLELYNMLTRGIQWKFIGKVNGEK